MASNTPNSYKHALVFGASGVSGWAVVNQLLQGYPNNQNWDKVTALTNRPLSLEVSQWPNKDSLQIVSGVNLLKGSTEDLMNVMKQQIIDVGNVTHVFYYGECEQYLESIWISLTLVDSIQGKHKLPAREERCCRYACTLHHGN